LSLRLIRPRRDAFGSSLDRAVGTDATARGPADGPTGDPAEAAAKPAIAIRASDSAATRDPAGRGSAEVLQLQATLLTRGPFPEAATALCTELADMLGVAQVALGFLEHGYAEVQAIAREADFESRRDLFGAIGAAMDEAIEQSATVVHPGRKADRPRITLAHAGLARVWGGTTITVPLVNGGEVIGALTFGGARNIAQDDATLAFCEQLATVLAPVLVLKREADRTWRQRLADGWFALRESVRTPGTQRLRLGMAVTALLALGILAGWSAEYRVNAPARIEGAVQRSLVAPADGFLRQAPVKPGDAVVAGQILAQLSDQDHELQRLKWTAEVSQHQNSARAALARGERTDYVIAIGKAQEAQAQLDLVAQAIERGSIRAPFDGVVIQGDLSQTLGAPVRRGDVLLTVAPSGEFRLVVEVDERDVGDVKSGAEGVVHLAALPREPVAFRVARVRPVATSRDGRNFFEVEAVLPTPPAAARPGLQGVAKIEAEDRALAWVWTHRIVDWARLTLWTLGG
jgi:hypothetical protein